MTVATDWADWIAGIEFEALPPEVIQKAKKSILDTVGVMIAGVPTEFGRIIGAYVAEFGAKPECPVLGTGLKTAPPLAALANATMGHAHDFDDTSMSFIGHPSVVVLPAALAAAEQANASGAGLILAYVIGTEVACKLGATTMPNLYADGWHSTSVIGAFGAAAAVAKLKGLTKAQTAHALGLVTAQVSGIKGSFGAAAKPYQVGRAAENGVAAAALAQRGFESAADIFEKEFGFFHTFKAGPGATTASDAQEVPQPGEPFDIDCPGFYLKAFPSCSSTHPALDATIALIRRHQIEPAAIEGLDCASTPLVVDSLTYADPQCVDQARFSLQFCLARALLNRGGISPADFSTQNLADPRTRQLMRKIELRLSPELAQKGYAPHGGAEEAIVEISLKDGTCRRYSLAEPNWRPDNMPGWETLGAKFRTCGAPVLAPEQLDRAFDLISELETLAKTSSLTALTQP